MGTSARGRGYVLGAAALRVSRVPETPLLQPPKRGGLVYWLRGRHFAGKQCVERKFPRTEDQNDDGSKQESVRGCCVEFVRVGEDVAQRLAVGGDVGHDHVNGESKRDQARAKSQNQQKSADEFE